MEFILKRIKRLIIQQQYLFTEKAVAERLADGLTEEDVLEAILNATFVRSKRSRSSSRQTKQEQVYIIESFTYDGLLVYTRSVCTSVYGKSAGWDGTARVSKRCIKASILALMRRLRLLTRAVPSRRSPVHSFVNRSKGVIRQQQAQDTFYILISAKRSTWQN